MIGLLLIQGAGMPKRDDTYMEAQREAVAQAALTVLLEKGYYETSLRDICRAAGISNGALYSYFPTRESVIVAACALDHKRQLDSEMPDSWEEYVRVEENEFIAGSQRSKRHRLSLQFTAELTQMEHNPEGLSLVYQTFRDNARRSLMKLKESGIISLPFGIDMTTELHMQLMAGLIHQLASDRDGPRDPKIHAFQKAMALTAGLVDSASD